MALNGDALAAIIIADLAIPADAQPAIAKLCNDIVDYFVANTVVNTSVNTTTTGASVSTPVEVTAAAMSNSGGPVVAANNLTGTTTGTGTGSGTGTIL